MDSNLRIPPGLAGEWAGIVLFAAHGVFLLCRIRPGPGASGRRGVRLADRAEVRPAQVAVGALLPLALILATGAMHRRWWLAEAPTPWARFGASVCTMPTTESRYAPGPGAPVSIVHGSLAERRPLPR